MLSTFDSFINGEITEEYMHISDKQLINIKLLDHKLFVYFSSFV